MSSSKVTKTVQAFQVDSSFDKIQSHLREDVNKRIDAFNMNTSRKKSLFLSFLIYQVAVQLEQGNRQEDCEKRDEKIA